MLGAAKEMEYVNTCPPIAITITDPVIRYFLVRIQMVADASLERQSLFAMQGTHSVKREATT
jgi:hypothetical protein